MPASNWSVQYSALWFWSRIMEPVGAFVGGLLLHRVVDAWFSARNFLHVRCSLYLHFHQLRNTWQVLRRKQRVCRCVDLVKLDYRLFVTVWKGAKRKIKLMCLQNGQKPHAQDRQSQLRIRKSRARSRNDTKGWNPTISKIWCSERVQSPKNNTRVASELQYMEKVRHISVRFPRRP